MRPLVVLVHGSLDRGTSFSRVVRRLPGCHVVTYDRRGYQRSRGAPPHAGTVADHVADLMAIVATRHVEGRTTVVVGHSYGAIVALTAATSGTGVISAAGAFEPALPWLEFWPGHGAPRPDPPPEPGAMAESFFRQLFGDNTWERMSEVARGEQRADGPALVADAWANRGLGPPFDTADIDIPIVLGYGDRTAERFQMGVQWLADRIDDAEVFVAPGAGHGAHISHPSLFASFVRRTLARATERTRTPS